MFFVRLVYQVEYAYLKWGYIIALQSSRVSAGVKKTLFTAKNLSLLLILFTMLRVMTSPDIVSSNKHPRY